MKRSQRREAQPPPPESRLTEDETRHRQIREHLACARGHIVDAGTALSTMSYDRRHLIYEHGNQLAALCAALDRIDEMEVTITNGMIPIIPG